MNNIDVKILRQGDESGNGMVVKYRLPSGLEILGLPTKNFYGGNWDLGPTWNWLVLADRPFLVDSGRYGQGASLVEMIREFGPSVTDLDFVLMSHGHEDHDGGLAELVELTDLKVKAHQTYAKLIRNYPDSAPPDHRKNFPAKCWHCVMPESFWGKNCLGYHEVLQRIEVEGLPDGRTTLATDVTTHHLPGHSPDCLAVQLGDEALLVGDVVLPDITPWPTNEESFNEVAGILNPTYTVPGELFGLRRYIRSLKELAEIAKSRPEILVLPAHRLYYKGRWNPVDLGGRIEELLTHHRTRCAAILEILKTGPKSAGEIAKELFEERLLEGFGKVMGRNEVISHCELLQAAGDVQTVGDHRYEAKGTAGFEAEVRRKG